MAQNVLCVEACAKAVPPFDCAEGPDQTVNTRLTTSVPLEIFGSGSDLTETIGRKKGLGGRVLEVP